MSRRNKRKKKPPASSQPTAARDSAVHLEESIEQATEAVRKSVAGHKVGIVVMIVVVVGLFALLGLFERLDEQRADAWNGEFYRVFTSRVTPATPTTPGSAVPDLTESEIDEIRSSTRQLVEEHLGNPCSVWMASRFAAWLIERDDPADRTLALEIMEKVRGAHADEPFLAALDEQYEALASAADFAIPPPAPEPEPEATAPNTVQPEAAGEPAAAGSKPGGGAEGATAPPGGEAPGAIPAVPPTGSTPTGSPTKEPPTTPPSPPTGQPTSQPGGE